MNEDTRDIIDTQLAKLPDSVRSAISNIDFNAQIRNLGTQFGLRVDQLGIIENEVMLVLLGLEHPDKFLSNLTSQAGLSRDVGTKIVSALNESIFKTIRHELVEVHQKDQLLDGALKENISLTELATPTTPQNSPITPAPVTQPTPVVPAPNTVAQTKLEQTFRVPPQTATVALNQTPIAPSAAKPIQHREVDPYREPIQ